MVAESAGHKWQWKAVCVSEFGHLYETGTDLWGVCQPVGLTTEGQVPDHADN